MIKSSRISSLTAIFDERSEEKRYWESRLSGGMSSASLVPVGPTGGDGTVKRFLRKFSARELGRISGGSPERLHALLYASLAVLLKKYTGQPDLLIGTPIYKQSGDARQYINQMICLRTAVERNDSFRTFAKRAGQNLQDALRHQNYPFELIARYLGFSGRDSWEVRGFFPVVLSLEGLHLKESFDGLDPELVFHFSPVSEGLGLNITYDTDRFGQNFVEGLAEHFDLLLAAMLGDTSAPLSSLGLADEGEVFLGNRSIVHFPRIDDWIYRASKDHPERTAITMKGTSISYAELDARTLGLAGHLREKGLMEGEHIGIMTTRSAATVIALIAVVRAGGVFVPIDHDAPTNRVRFIMDECKLRFMIVDRVDPDIGTGRQLQLDSLLELSHRPHKPFSLSNDPEALCYTLFTSGTTGEPKGCRIKHGSFANYIDWVHRTYLKGIEIPIFGWFTPLSFDFTLTSIFGALSSGGEIIVYEQQLPIEEILIDVFDTENPINIVKLTPSHIAMLGILGLSETNIEVVIAGGEQLEAKHLRAIGLIDKQIIIFNEYGPTEATVGCIVAQVNDPSKSIPIGTPIPNTATVVIDADGRPLPEGIPGEIFLSGDNLMEGYLNNKDQGRLTYFPWFKDTLFYRTGDIGYRYKGLYYYLGRADQEIKLRGHRIHPSEITAVLERLDQVKQAFVTKVDDEVGDVLIGYLMVNREVDVDKIKQHLALYLPDYMVPAHLFVVESFPIKPSGKIDMESLPSYRSWKGSGAIYTAPRNPLEKKIAGIWKEVLSREQVGVFDNFFLIGGHSLHATQVITRIKKDITDNIDFRALYSYPDISRLAAHIEVAVKMPAKENRIDIVPTQEQDLYPVSHAQHRLWIIDQLDSSKQGYITSGMYSIEGELDTEAFSRAFDTLVDRHEILRSRIVKVGGEPKQKVLTRQEIGFRTKLQNFKGDEHRAKEQIQKVLHAPFALDTGPLIRVLILKRSKDRHYLGISFHHIICDGASMEVILREIRECYGSYSKNDMPKLPELKVQYRDFAIWEKRMLDQQGEEMSRFWKEHLAGRVEEMELPLDFPRPEKRSYTGGIAELKIEGGSLGELRSIAQELDVGLFAILMSSIKVLTFHITRTTDITIGTAVSGRNQLELEQQIGLYVNTLPFRSNINPEQRFDHFIRKEHERMIDMLQHQKYPFDKIVEDTDHKSKPNRNPLFDIGFTYNPSDNNSHQGFILFDSAISIQNMSKNQHTVKSDIWFHAFNQADKLIIELEFNKDLFKNQTPQRLIDLLDYILCQIKWSDSISELCKKIFDFEVSKRKINLKLRKSQNLERLIK